MNKVTKAEIIKSLLDQALDKDSFVDDDGPDCIFAQDAIALREAAELLKAAPEWVSVKDKLPEDMEDVLVFVRAGDSNWYDVTWHHRGTWRKYGCGIAGMVTHWMPILKPPEGRGTA